MAAANGHVACLEMLVKCGGFILSRNKLGETPLQVAERLNQEDIIHFVATNLQSIKVVFEIFKTF